MMFYPLTAYILKRKPSFVFWRREVEHLNLFLRYGFDELLPQRFARLSQLSEAYDAMDVPYMTEHLLTHGFTSGHRPKNQAASRVWKALTLAECVELARSLLVLAAQRTSARRRHCLRR